MRTRLTAFLLTTLAVITPFEQQEQQITPPQQSQPLRPPQPLLPPPQDEYYEEYEAERPLVIMPQPKYLISYFERRIANNRYRAIMDGPRPTRMDIYYYSEARTPSYTLTAPDINHWPDILLGPAYTSELIELKKSTGISTYEKRNSARANTTTILATLKANINDYNPQDYIEAKRFIQGLGHALTH